MASTPKCSHTAGQNCSLQVMKSSSRLGRAEEGFSNAAHEGAEGHSQRGIPGGAVPDPSEPPPSPFALGAGQFWYLHVPPDQPQSIFRARRGWEGRLLHHPPLPSALCQGGFCYSGSVFAQLSSPLPTPGIKSPSYTAGSDLERFIFLDSEPPTHGTALSLNLAVLGGTAPG